MLENAGISVISRPAQVDEASIKKELLTAGASPAEIAEDLAIAKAMTVSNEVGSALVLGADQILVHDGQIMSKAKNRQEARRKLRLLSGSTHRLISCAAFVRSGNVLWRCSMHADLSMREFTEAFLDRYLDAAGSALLDSVGCYYLEDIGVQLFEEVNGDYFTVLGLPLLPVLRYLRREGVIET